MNVVHFEKDFSNMQQYFGSSQMILLTESHHSVSMVWGRIKVFST
jgi:hypothetical protein